MKKDEIKENGEKKKWKRETKLDTKARKMYKKEKKKNALEWKV